MSNKQGKPAARISISPPELPTGDLIESLPDGQLNEQGRYDNLSMSNQSLSGQIASRVTIRNARFQDVGMAATKLRSLKLTDARFDHCDLANADWYLSTLCRIEISNCRMTGIRVIGSSIKDASVEDCKIDLAQFRTSNFRDCRFSNCNLRESDFYEADLQGVVFSNCDLRGAQISGAKLRGTDFRGSQLEGLQVRAEDLQGAIIDPLQLVALAQDLAHLLGLKVLPVGELR
jgi:uncharacterized protein YjbI with pentapeptide repeats